MEFGGVGWLARFGDFGELRGGFMIQDSIVPMFKFSKFLTLENVIMLCIATPPFETS